MGSRRELIRRVDDPEDRRGVFVELTAKGLRRVDAVLEHHVELERHLLDDLTGTEQGHLADLLRRLLLSLGDEAVTRAG
jgi:DNA-binding MarR family transcriptional regulator